MIARARRGPSRAVLEFGGLVPGGRVDWRGSSSHLQTPDMTAEEQGSGRRPAPHQGTWPSGAHARAGHPQRPSGQPQRARQGAWRAARERRLPREDPRGGRGHRAREDEAPVRGALEHFYRATTDVNTTWLELDDEAYEEVAKLLETVFLVALPGRGDSSSGRALLRPNGTPRR